MKESFFRCTALFLLSLACLVGQTFALPAAALVGDEGDQCTSQPGDEQGDEQAEVAAGGLLRCAGEVGDGIGDRNTDDDRGDDGDPHRGDRVARAAHGTGQALRDRHGNVADGQDHHHVLGQRDQLSRRGEQTHDIFAKQDDQTSDDEGSTHRDEGALTGTDEDAVCLVCADVLAGEGGHGHTEGEVRHHDEAIHTHDDDVGRDDHFTEGIGQGLDQDHGGGEDHLGDTGGNAQPDGRTGIALFQFQILHFQVENICHLDQFDEA